MSGDGSITHFKMTGIRSFRVGGDLEVQVIPRDADSSSNAANLAEWLSDRSGQFLRPAAQSAVHFVGKAYVRTLAGGDGTQRAWLLGGREKGWSHFGYGFKSVEELFRCVPCVVTNVGEDEHGIFIEVSAS